MKADRPIANPIGIPPASSTNNKQRISIASRYGFMAKSEAN